MSAYELVTLDITFTGDETFDHYTLTAPTGKKPIAGGMQCTAGAGFGYPVLCESYPSGDTWKFTVQGFNASTTSTLYLVCLPTYTITPD